MTSQESRRRVQVNTTRTRSRSFERLLVEGMKGTGKSYQWLLLARALQSTGAIFHVIDCDDAIERMLETEFPDLLEGGNVIVHPVFDWPDYLTARDEITSVAKPNDWIIGDMIDNAWKAVQSYFVEQVFKQDIGDYFLAARIDLASKGDKTDRGKTARNLQPMKGWVDWIVVNRLYDSFMLPLLKTRAHLYFTTGVNIVSSDDDEATRDLYGPFGVTPRGQKNLPHQVHTEFLFQQDAGKMNSWQISTVKDRGRKYFDHAPLIDLTTQYFMKVVGWDV